MEEGRSTWHGRGRILGAGFGAGAIGVVATILVAAGVTNLLQEPIVDIGTLAAVAVVSVPVGLGIGVRYRSRWPWPAFVAAGVIGAFLFLRGQAFLVQGNPISYPLLFGFPGAVVAVGGSIGGAWIGSQRDVAHSLSPSRLSPLARGGLVVAVMWTLIEFLFALGLVPTVGSALDNRFAGVLVATVVSFPIAAVVAIRYGLRVGIEREDWEYRTDGRTIAVGFVSGVVVFLALQGVGLVVASTVGTDETVATFGFLLSDIEAGVWVLALFVLAHGIIAPLAEELAWRGIVQTALVKSHGPAVGILITVALFTTKHAVLDASLARVPSLLVLGVALGVVRHRWGTTASTVLHAVVNLAAVAGLMVLVFG
jgi:hypothetical protein